MMMKQTHMKPTIKKTKYRIIFSSHQKQLNLELTCIQTFDVDDTVRVYEAHIGEDYHIVTGATEPLHCQDSNNTAISQKAHLTAEQTNSSWDPVNQTALAI